MPALLLLTGPSSGLRFEVRAEAILGRSAACEIPLEDVKISRRHARVEVRAGQAFLADLGSRNGTLLNGEQVVTEVLLRPGDRFQVGETTVLFEPSAPETVDAATQADFNAQRAEQLLPTEGLGGFLLSLVQGALAATSAPAMLRAGAERLAEHLGASWVTVLVQRADGPATACTVGAAQIVARPLFLRVVSKGEAVWDGEGLGVPFGPARAPYGALFVERGISLDEGERRLVVAAGRLLGDLWHRPGLAEPQRVRAPVGGSGAFLRLLERVREVSAGSENVVLWGPPGSGKGMLARYLHAHSPRGAGPCLEVDAREPSARVEEALFGGSTAPGVPSVPSALARAEGGTLILRHVESLSRALSERLARYLAHPRGPGLGGEGVQLHVRVVATSKLPPQALRTAERATLGDLRSGVELEVPGLAAHASDVPQLFAHFAEAVAARTRQPPPALSTEAAELLAIYAWPQNVEELRLVTERLALLYPGEEVPTFHLPPEFQKVAVPGTSPSLQDMIARLERDAISEALKLAKGKKIRAAALLDISRPTLDKKIEDYQLKVEKVRDE